MTQIFSHLIFEWSELIHFQSVANYTPFLLLNMMDLYALLSYRLCHTKLQFIFHLFFFRFYHHSLNQNQSYIALQKIPN